jgi:hypothetical protein
MWVGTFIQKFSPIKSEVFYLIEPSEKKILFEALKIIKTLYKYNLEIPSRALEYIIEDDQEYFVYINGEKENKLKEVIEELSLISKNSEENFFDFYVEEFNPYFLELSYNEYFITEGYSKKYITCIGSSLKFLENICLDYLSELHLVLKDNKEFDTIEKCLKFLEIFKLGEKGNWGIDLNIKIKYYENNIFSLLKEYKLEDENVKKYCGV